MGQNEQENRPSVKDLVKQFEKKFTKAEDQSQSESRKGRRTQQVTESAIVLSEAQIARNKELDAIKGQKENTHKEANEDIEASRKQKLNEETEENTKKFESLTGLPPGSVKQKIAEAKARINAANTRSDGNLGSSSNDSKPQSGITKKVSPLVNATTSNSASVNDPKTKPVTTNIQTSFQKEDSTKWNKFYDTIKEQRDEELKHIASYSKKSRDATKLAEAEEEGQKQQKKKLKLEQLKQEIGNGVVKKGKDALEKIFARGTNPAADIRGSLKTPGNKPQVQHSSDKPNPTPVVKTDTDTDTDTEQQHAQTIFLPHVQTPHMSSHFTPGSADLLQFAPQGFSVATSGSQLDEDRFTKLLRTIVAHPEAQSSMDPRTYELSQTQHIIKEAAACAREMPLKPLDFNKRSDGTYDVVLSSRDYTGPVLMPRLGEDGKPIYEAGNQVYDVLVYQNGKVQPELSFIAPDGVPDGSRSTVNPETKLQCRNAVSNTVGQDAIKAQNNDKVTHLVLEFKARNLSQNIRQPLPPGGSYVPPPPRPHNPGGRGFA